MNINSRIPGFYKLTVQERRKLIASLVNLSEDELKQLKGENIAENTFNTLIENVIGILPLPFGIATNFRVNGKDYLVPMTVEESSVVAAASHAAKIARKKGGFFVNYSGSIVIGQLQILNIKNFEQAKEKLLKHKTEILDIANATNKILIKLGGGAKDIEIRKVRGDAANYLILHLIVDTKDAMGANAVNTMLETLQPKIEELTGGNVLLRIISNYAIKRTVKVKAIFDKELLGGEKIVDNIIFAYDFAKYDTFRAVTHNKGIMNGVTAVMLATGNDTRAIEAGAHAYAARNGFYSSLSDFSKDKDGNLVGYLEMPLAVGIIGGAINVHPSYRIALKILGVKSAQELAEVAGAVGLAQNLAALRALADEGIQAGHMTLHAKNIAVTAGAKDEEIDIIAQKLINNRKISFDEAEQLLKELRKTKNKDQ